MSATHWQDDDDDDELGFVGAAIKAAGGAVKGIKKIAGVFKKKKKKKKAAAAAKKTGKVTVLDAQNIVGEIPKKVVEQAATTKAAKAKIKQAAKGLDPNDVRGIVREVVGSVPSPVRQIVLDALKAYRDESAANVQARAALTEQVDAALKPDIAAMLAVLQAQQLQGTATHEHRELVDREEFRRKTREGLGTIDERLRELAANMQSLQKRLNGSAVVSPAKVPVFGPRNVLDG